VACPAMQDSLTGRGHSCVMFKQRCTDASVLSAADVLRAADVLSAERYSLQLQRMTLKVQSQPHARLTNMEGRATYIL